MRLTSIGSLVSIVALLTVTTATASAHRFIANNGNQLCIFDGEKNLEWSMALKAAPHDMHWMADNQLLTHQGTEVIIVDIAKKKIIWSFDARRLSDKHRVEVHAVQPIDENRIMIALSGEGKIFEIDRDGEVHNTIKLVINNPHPHRDTRLVRRLDNGNYLVSHEGDGVIREYDVDGQVVWEFLVPLFGKDRANGHGPEAFGNQAFSAIRLKNGNTLIGTGNGHSILEVDHDKNIVWKVTQNDIEGVILAWVTTVEVLPNGHIVIGNCHAGAENPQLIEIDHEKKLHWSFGDFKLLGNSASNSQILDIQGTIR